VKTEGDLAVRNAHVITMEPGQPFADSLVVKAGEIAAVGTWPQVAPACERIEPLDLEGRTVIPGLIDTHTHFLWTALHAAAVNLEGVQDHQGLKEIIDAAVGEASPGEPILGMGYTEYPLEKKGLRPIITALDSAAPRNPVFLIGVTGHSSALNLRAMEILDPPEDVPGLLRDELGKPNGLLTDRANSHAQAKFHARFEWDQLAQGKIPEVIAEAHSVGLTTLHALEGSPDGGLDESVGAFWARIPELPLRFVLYFQTLDVDKAIELDLPRIGGCILLDGDVGPRTAALLEPYADDPTSSGTLYYEQERVDDFALEAHQAGLQIAFHAVGDAAVEQALSAYEFALEKVPREDHRHSIEHCEVIQEGQVQRAQDLGVALAIQPPFNYYWPHEDYQSSLGEARMWGVDPVRSLVRPGLLVAGGSDSTVTPLGPMIGVHAAVNHSNPLERISVHEALKLYTIDAARIALQERDRGS
jgi:predicted amidohydrolase YtcJ